MSKGYILLISGKLFYLTIHFEIRVVIKMFGFKIQKIITFK